LDAELEWEKVLSVGEQERLAFARILLSRPQFILLDEATSALDLANESRLYQTLKSTSATIFSVSHHYQLIKYHDQVLELAGDGDWTLRPAAEFEGLR
jgi:putative ATP-binding cassette transporter